MKKLLVLIGLFIPCVCSSQVLDVQWAGNEGYIFKTDSNEYVYEVTSGQTCWIYNSQHALLKTVTLGPIPPVTNRKVLLVSKKLFNNDSKFEIVYIIYTTGTEMRIIDEDGNILLDEANCNGVSFYNTPNGVKMINYCYPAGLIKVYSLPGVLFSSGKQENSQPEF